MRRNRPLYVVDASLVLQWYFHENEKELQQALQIRQDFRLNRIDLCAPELLGYEVANVLRYKEGLDEKTIVNAVTALYDMKMLVTADSAILESAVKIALKYNVTVYDSVYLSLARSFGCDLITADRKLLRKLQTASDVLSLHQYRM